MKYRLKHGKHSIPVQEKDANGNTRTVRKRIQAGDTVELSPQAAKAFADRFEPASDAPAASVESGPSGGSGGAPPSSGGKGGGGR